MAQNRNGRLNYGVRLDNSQLRIDAAESRRLLRGIGTTAKQEGETIDSSMKKIGAAMAGVFAVSKLKDFAMQVANVRGEFQQLEIAFQTMLGNKRQADALMSQLIETAVITPFNMSDIANSAKQLLAYGVAADEVNDTLVRLGDIAAGLSIPINDLAYLYGTTMVQGRMYTQDLNQFLGRGIPITEELSKQFKVAKNKVKDLVTEGKVGFPEVEKAIIALTSEGGRFAGLMEAQSKSITGQMSNIEDAIEQMFNEIGKKSEGAISATLDGVGKVIDNWESIGKCILVVIAAYGSYKAALLAVWAAHKLVNIAGAVSAFFSLAKGIKTAKDAMVLLSMVTKASPIGLILGVVGASAAAFGLFSDKVDKAAAMSKKFGETAAQQINQVDTLATTLAGLTVGTSTHRKVIEELNGILEEYGITQIKEGDNIDIINEKRAKAIELIKQEAVERQRANALDQGAQDYAKQLEDARNQLLNDLSGAMTGSFFLSGNSEIQENATAISTIIGNVVEENITAIAGKTGKEYQQGLDKIFGIIQDRMRAIGISEKTIQSGWFTDNLFNHQNLVQNYIETLQQARESYDNYTEAINKAADAEKEAANATTTFSERVNATETQLKGATDDVHTLYKNIKSLMSQYSQNTIGFDIVFSGKPPKWMEEMELPELQRLAARFSALGAQAGNEGLTVNGRHFTKQELLQRGADYAQAAENKQQEADKRQRELDATEKERKRKAEQDRKKAERERKTIADQTSDRLKAIAEYEKAVLEQTEKAELDIRQKKLDLLQDGFDKEKSVIDLNYDRLIAENAERERQMLEALADNKVREWMNANPKATKQQQLDYRSALLDPKSENALTSADLTAEQQAQLKAYSDLANEIRLKSERELYTRLLEQYQDYEEQRKAITERYARERAALEAVSIDRAKDLIPDWDKMTAEQRTKAWEEYSVKVQVAISELGKKEKKEIKSVNDEQVQSLMQSSSLMVDLFTDAADKSNREIKKLVEQAEALLEYLKSTSSEDITPSFGFTTEQLRTLKSSPEKIKAITEKVTELKAISKKGNPFKALAEDIKAIFSQGKDGNKKESTEARLKKLGQSVSECADQIGGMAGELSEMFDAVGNEGLSDAMSSVQDVMTSVSNIGQGFAKGGLIGGIAAAAGEAIGWVTKAFQANARHKQALKEIMKEVTAQQKAYNLALLEESLAMEKADTVFGTIDYMKSVNAVNVMRDAWAELRKEIEGTAAQQYKFSYKNTGNSFWNSIFNHNYSKLKDAYSGLADIQIKTGHKKTGLFGWGKGKDIYSSILDVYPELIDKQGNFNRELAQSIIDTRTFSGEGKEALQYMIDLYDKAQEAYDQVKDYLTGIFGELGNTLSDALADAFRNGTDAAEAFADSVSKMLEDLGQQMIFSALFNGIIQQANDKMLDTMMNVNLTEEQKFNQYVAILDQMTDGILGQQGNYNALMEKYKQMAEAKGISLWESNEEPTREPSQKGIATASQESVDELNGRTTAIQGHTFSISENTKILVTTTNAILKSVLKIERNTDEVPVRLAAMEQSLKTVKDTVNDIALKGIKIK